MSGSYWSVSKQPESYIELLGVVTWSFNPARDVKSITTGDLVSWNFQVEILSEILTVIHTQILFLLELQ